MAFPIEVWVLRRTEEAVRKFHSVTAKNKSLLIEERRFLLSPLPNRPVEWFMVSDIRRADVQVFTCLLLMYTLHTLKTVAQNRSGYKSRSRMGAS